MIDEILRKCVDKAYEVMDSKSFADPYTEAKDQLFKLITEQVIENTPIYEGDDSMGKEYQRGYNNMVIATRLLVEQQRQALKELFGGQTE